jgi:hypothetical protein
MFAKPETVPWHLQPEVESSLDSGSEVIPPDRKWSSDAMLQNRKLVHYRVALVADHDQNVRKFEGPIWSYTNFVVVLHNDQCIAEFTAAREVKV